MPDRYGDGPDAEQPGMTARELCALALTVPCRYCGADRGQPCVNKRLPHHPPTRIPHTARTNDAIEVPF